LSKQLPTLVEKTQIFYLAKEFVFLGEKRTLFPGTLFLPKTEAPSLDMFAILSSFSPAQQLTELSFVSAAPPPLTRPRASPGSTRMLRLFARRSTTSPSHFLLPCPQYPSPNDTGSPQEAVHQVSARAMR
jgi:hypothetical protein